MKRLLPILCAALLLSAPVFAADSTSEPTEKPATESKEKGGDKFAPDAKKEPKDGVLVNYQPGNEKAKTGKITGSYAQIRENPSLNAPSVGKKVRGDSYTVINESRNWLRVRFEDGLEGYLYSKGSAQDSESESAAEPKAEPMGLPPLPDLAGASGTPDAKGKEKTEEKVAKTDESGSKNVKSEKASEMDSGKAAKDDKVEKDGKDSKEAKAATDAKASKDKKEKKDSKDKKDAKEAKDTKDKADEKASGKKTLAEASVPGEGTTGPRAVTSSRTAEDYYNQAIELFERKRYSEALEANKSALELAPRNAEILNNLGNCLYKLDQLDEAVSRWKEALGLSPRSAKICNNLGIAYYQNDDNAKAIEYYKKAVLFEPQFPDPYYNLASVYGFKGQFNEALEYYKKYLEFPVDQTMKRLTEERIDYCEKQLALAVKKKGK